MSAGRHLQVPGVELDGVVKATDNLLNVNRGYHVQLGTRVVGGGGGFVAFDAASTSLRETPSEREHARADLHVLKPEDGVDPGARDRDAEGSHVVAHAPEASRDGDPAATGGTAVDVTTFFRHALRYSHLSPRSDI